MLIQLILKRHNKYEQHFLKIEKTNTATPELLSCEVYNVQTSGSSSAQHLSNSFPSPSLTAASSGTHTLLPPFYYFLIFISLPSHPTSLPRGLAP